MLAPWNPTWYPSFIFSTGIPPIYAVPSPVRVFEYFDDNVFEALMINTKQGVPFEVCPDYGGREKMKRMREREKKGRKRERG
jgi:hypothetical protein